MIESYCFPAVLKAQCALARGVHDLNPHELLMRQSWIELSQLLVDHYFKRALDDNRALMAEVYRHAMFWYPILQQRARGNYRPCWSMGTALTWFRQAVSKRTGQYFLLSGEFSDEDYDREHWSKLPDQLMRLPGVRDRDFVMNSLNFLHDVMRTGGRKAAIPAYIVATLFYLNVDRQMDAQYHWSATPTQRRKQQAKGEGKSSYLRVNHQWYLVADSMMTKRHPQQHWLDLRYNTVPILNDFVLRYDTDSSQQRASIQLTDACLRDLKAEVGALKYWSATAQYKLRLLNKLMTKIQLNYRYANGAAHQLGDIGRHAAKTRRRLKAALGQETASLPLLQVDNTLYIPKPNPFLSGMTQDEWRAVFSPYLAGT